jgi:CheY-like chemotaxis protein
MRGYEVVSADNPTACPVYGDMTADCPHEFACGDILITDNQMPYMTGLEFVQRQTQRGCKGVVHNKAVTSAYWADDDLQRADRLGCKVFKKPFDLVEINQWLDEREKNIAQDRQLIELDLKDGLAPGAV